MEKSDFFPQVQMGMIKQVFFFVAQVKFDSDIDQNIKSYHNFKKKSLILWIRINLRDVLTIHYGASFYVFWENLHLCLALCGVLFIVGAYLHVLISALVATAVAWCAGAWAWRGHG